ncbi:hypothetical protein BC939DRAFT_388304, partial [Gamsiella multidivaricata]|uniref:uncharacterized protein n=1 Tax=Gamsiella multidivaricata TaxID=101098 RepID=UPI0022209BF8
IPVFFFLTVLFGTKCYTGPYRNVEKGILILYMLLQGTTISDMDEFLPKNGGYTLHLEGIIAASDTLTSSTFCRPIRKRKGIELTEEEIRYNAVFGSFRSKVESYFGDMQTTFTKFSHTVVNRASDKGIFSLQYKLCCLLSNIKRMVALRNITMELYHNYWTQDDFDYPNGD